MAWIYPKYNRDRSLLALEHEARGAKRGLWTDPNLIPPWEYRHGGKTGWCGSLALRKEPGTHGMRWFVEGGIRGMTKTA